MERRKVITLGKVSIIVPIYNVEPFLEQCIRSLTQQTYTDLEIILVNDESPDHSLEICRQWEKKDGRILVIDQKNQGVSVARNQGIKRCTGEWICFVDGDDWLEPTAIEQMMAQVDSFTDVLITDYFVDTMTRSWRESFFTLEEHDFCSDEKIELIKNCFLKTSFSNKNAVTAVGVPWAKLFRTKFIKEKSILFDKALRKMQDAIFCIEVFEQCQNITYRQIATYHYRQNDASVCHKPNKNYQKVAKSVLDAFLEFIHKYHYEQELLPVYNARKFMFAFESVKFIYLLDNTGMRSREKIHGIKNMMRELHFSRREEKEMQVYLGKAHKLAFFVYKLHAYRLMYFMLKVYFEHKLRKMK